MMSKNKTDKSYAKFHISMDDSGTEVNIEGLGLNILNMLASSALNHESVLDILERVMSAVKREKANENLN